MINRREFIYSSLMLAGHASFGSRHAFASLVNDAKVKALQLRINCVMEVLKPPKDRDISIWTPLPHDYYDQKVTGLAVSSAFPYRVTEEPVFGNRMYFFKADRLKPGDRIVLKYNLYRKASDTVEDRDEKPERHLEPSEWEKWDDNIARYTDSLAGKETDPVKIARKIYDALIDSLTYLNEACGRGVSILTFEEKTGRCDEFHALFRSMMMYKKIPVKWEQGIALPYPSVIKKKGEVEADCINSQSWLRFYTGNSRWMPVDLAEAKKRPDLRDFFFGRLVPNRIRMSTGRGMNLNPPQQSPVNTFPYTYAEADGLPLIYGHHYKNVLKYEVIKTEV